MSIEKAIELLTNEINRLCKLLEINNQLLQTKNEVPSPKSKKMLNEADAAIYIGMSRSFLAQDRMNGHRENRTKGPTPTKVGQRSIRYEQSELDAWLERNKKYR